MHMHMHMHVVCYLPHVFMTAVCCHQTKHHLSKRYSLEAKLDTTPIEDADRALQQILEDKEGVHSEIVECASPVKSSPPPVAACERCVWHSGT